MREQPPLGRARAALVVYFVLLGTSVATWGARIPAIKHQLHLSDGALGLALFAVPCGSVLTFPVTGRLADRFGGGALLRVAGPLTALLLIGPALAGSLPWLVVALSGYGASAGLLDVTMNAAAARLEPAYGRPIMSSLHASYSLAGLFGAGLGGFFAAAGIGPLATFVAAAVPLSILGAVASRWVVTPAAWPHAAGQRNAAEASPADVRPAELLPAETLPAETLPAASAGEASPTAPAVMPAAVPSAAAPGIGAPRSPSSAPSAAPAAAPGAKLAMIIWAFGLLALCEQVGEGSAGDWSAVYLHDSLGTSAGFAAVGLIAFSIAMTVGRLAGDALAARFGPVSLVRCGGLVAAAGLGGGLAFASPVSGIAGFTLLGTGLAVIFPQIIAAAGRLDPARAGRSFARIAGVGYTGLLGGPVVIGFAAGLVGLPAALLIPAVLALVVVALAGTLGAGAVGAGVVRGAAVSAGD